MCHLCPTQQQQPDTMQQPDQPDVISALSSYQQRKLKETPMYCRSLQCLIITDMQVFHREILPRRCGTTGRNPSGAANQTAAVGRWRLEGKELFKEERRATIRVGGQGWGGWSATWKAGSDQALLAIKHTAATHTCMHPEQVDLLWDGQRSSCLWLQGDPRNYYFIIFKENPQSQYLWLQAQLNEPKKSVNGSLFTSGIRIHS